MITFCSFYYDYQVDPLVLTTFSSCRDALALVVKLLRLDRFIPLFWRLSVVR